MRDIWVEAVFALAPVAVLLQPLAQQRHQVPFARVDLFGQWGDGFGTRRQWAERIAEDVAERSSLELLSRSRGWWHSSYVFSQCLPGKLLQFRYPALQSLMIFG